MDPKSASTLEEVKLEMDPKLASEPAKGSLDAGFNNDQPKLAKAEQELLLDDHSREIPPWHHQITFRALFVGAGISVLFCIMVLKLAFTVGIIPSLNIAAGLLGFVGLKTLTVGLAKIGWPGRPFTQQENTVIQTTVVAGYSLAFSGGFSSFLLGMDWTSYLQSDGSTITNAADLYLNPPVDLPEGVIQPSLGKFIGFMFIIGFAGIFCLVPLRKTCIIDYRLTYPSGTATGVIIKGFHTPLGEETAKAQVKTLGKWGAISFCWSLFKWMFSGFGDSCGFDSFPSLGFTAYYWKWYFDFSQTYIGIGMICPVQVTYSLMAGAILSYGIMWPLIEGKQGDWFPNGKKYGEGGSNTKGLQGYKVFIAVAFILGDGLYNIVKIIFISIRTLRAGRQAAQSLPTLMAGGQHAHAHATDGTGLTDADEAGHTLPPAGEEAVGNSLNPAYNLMGSPGGESIEEQLRIRNLRDKVFMQGAIPTWVAIAGYVVVAALSIGIMPTMWPGVKAYYVLVAYILAPIFGFCNAYGMGLTDWSLLTTYGKVCIFLFAAWGGANGGGIIAGLATATAMAVIVGAAADLMQDFKTGWLTFTSPRSMFFAQICGMAMSCFIAPLTFWLYWKGFQLGVPDSTYPAPFAVLYREMAVLAVQGSSTLPSHCLQISAGAFFGAILINVIRAHLVKPWMRKYIPIPMCLGIPAYLGPYFVIDMSIGAGILLAYRWVNRADCKKFAPVIGSALVAGDGIWTVVSAILALAGAVPPMCLYFFKGDQTTVANLDAYPH